MDNVSFGLDFGGVTTKKSTLVRADLTNNGELYFIVIENHPLVNNDDTFAIVKKTREEIFNPIINSSRSIYIDVLV